MIVYLVDANLPYYFSFWKEKKFLHVFDINDSFSDEEIWQYAKENDLTIITKDADFSSKILIKSPPPKVIHLRIGNMRIKDMYDFLSRNWVTIIEMSETHKLVNVYSDRIEGIE